MAPGAVAQAVLDVGLKVAPTERVPPVAAMVCAAAVSVSAISPGEADAQSFDSKGPSAAAPLGQVWLNTVTLEAGWLPMSAR